MENRVRKWKTEYANGNQGTQMETRVQGRVEEQAKKTEETDDTSCDTL